jgi:serine protease Do
MSRGLQAGLGLACALAVAAPAGVGAASKGADKRAVRVLVGGGASLGVSLDEVRTDDVSRLALAEERGALVREVDPDSPAAEAGLQKDDVIVGYQGQPVQSAAQLARLVRETPGGRKVALEVSRGGSLQKLAATLADNREVGWPGDLDFDFDVPMPAIGLRPPRPPRAPRPPAPPVPAVPHADILREFGPLGDMDLWGRRARLGLMYQELGEQLAGYFKVEGGLLVTSVNEGSPAAQAGIKAGDVILRLNGKEIRSSEDLREELDRTESGQEVTLGLQREGRALELKARPTERSPRSKRSAIRS